jgi:hypothetical protein
MASQGLTGWTKTVGTAIFEADGEGETHAKACHLPTVCEAHDGPGARTDLDSRTAFSGLGLFRMRMGVQACGTARRQLIPGDEGELLALAR